MRSIGQDSEPQGFVFESLLLNMNWVLSGQKIDSRGPIFRGQESGGLEMRLTWIGYYLDENQGPIDRSSQFCDQCQTKELTNFAFDVR